MKIQLDDNGKHLEFAPLTLTRSVGDLRVGILTNAERWKLLVPDAEISFATEDYLQNKFPKAQDVIRVNACVIPNQNIVDQVRTLKPGEDLLVGENWIAGTNGKGSFLTLSGEMPIVLKKRWDLFEKNGAILKQDFDLITKGRTTVQLSSTNTIIGDPNLIFLEEGATVEAATLNTKSGPIYIGKNAEVMEGSLLRGPIAMCESAVFKLGTKVYGPTTLGPFCKVGGEVTNVIFQAYSNKGHDGFLGNSLIGEWCNIGADTNSSNLKNNYGKVKTYSYQDQVLIQTDVQFMGLVMGDHSKCGINTMFNTATVVGVSSNVFGAEFPAKFVPSFTWGTLGEKYNFDKALESANNMMDRRGITLSKAEISILKYISDKN
ncbi:putative sugar nucleotidyl transferase [Crocinitomicaceae bacterium]|nr:putative sugar nucleotidyl transferase [Crocinitomicaceae bacterium]MDC1385359.1 putative sugar nucleotidyl transferase [Crocinitomicaceae bacterium]